MCGYSTGTNTSFRLVEAYPGTVHVQCTSVLNLLNVLEILRKLLNNYRYLNGLKLLAAGIVPTRDPHQPIHADLNPQHWNNSHRFSQGTAVRR